MCTFESFNTLLQGLKKNGQSKPSPKSDKTSMIKSKNKFKAIIENSLYNKKIGTGKANKIKYNM